ncbi:MAG: hypothetical protein JJ896_09960 [Rhodothermales bacterium]|nr:hypothetical protein [Rhodothermales bacterium]MBO6779965.1 hypothetical protein [Rhodothermales bacterium]
MKRFLALLAALTLPLTALAQPVRHFQDGYFTSSEDPAIRIRIAPEFTYVGSISFILFDRADVERYVWVKAPKGRVEAMVVFQFEGLRDGVEGRYAFSIPEGNRFSSADHRFSPERIEMGGLRWVHNTWAFDNARNASENPDAESARTLAMLEDAGYGLPDELIMSRYVTEVGQESRKELILFYMEPISASGHTLADFGSGPEIGAEFDALSDQVVRRGEGAFRVQD